MIATWPWKRDDGITPKPHWRNPPLEARKALIGAQIMRAALIFQKEQGAPPLYIPGIFRFRAGADGSMMASSQPEDRVIRGWNPSVALEAGAGKGLETCPSP